MTHQRSPATALLALLGLVGFVVWLTRAGPGAETSPSPCPGDAECATTSEGRPYVSTATLELDRDTVCPDSGYLCAKLSEEPEMRLLRWPDTERVIRVRIPLPPGEDPARATQLQQAARRGILAWNGYPMRIRVLGRTAAREDADIVVRWADRLSDNRLGQARTEWMDAGGSVTFRVADFALVRHNPYDQRVRLSPREVELTAAHEMGHALGLPHSDSEHDVMFPENTAVRLTSRDFRTVQALYALPGGARIR